MRFIADTHALIWWWTGNERRLSGRAASLLADTDNVILMSVASSWEIITKHRLGKLPELDDPVVFLPRMIARDALELMPIRQDHAVLAGGFTAAHGDPFDRMIAAQAIIAEIPILSRDDKLDAFGCQRIWG